MIFDIVNGELVVSEHTLMIEPFCTIWESDTTPKKIHAMKLFKFVDLVCSPKKTNPYFGLDEEERIPRVKKEIYKDENYRTTDFMIQSIEKYKELLEHASPTYAHLNAGLVASNKLKHYLLSFNLDERTPNGAMVIKPKDITSALREIPDVAKGIIEMIGKVKYELTESSKTRNQREIGQYER